MKADKQVQKLRIQVLRAELYSLQEKINDLLKKQAELKAELESI